MNKMKNNSELQKDVQDSIKWEPLLNAAEIGVTAKDGIVTLSGTVDSYTKKLEAENAAKNTAGVNALVEKIKVKFGDSWQKDDNEIATEILNAYKWNWEIPNDKVKVKVEDGWVTLEGQLEWNFQRETAQNLVNIQSGVKGVTNNISIKSETHDAIEKKDIEDALDRNWSIDREDIHIKVAVNKVTLTGTVSSYYQKDEAERIARNAPGVWSVVNDLVVEYDYSFAD
jgi:osmotically-inducible protein OsmY